jgi:hypothetical protein
MVITTSILMDSYHFNSHTMATSTILCLEQATVLPCTRLVEDISKLSPFLVFSCVFECYLGAYSYDYYNVHTTLP